MLKSLGVEADSAYNGQEAIEKVVEASLKSLQLDSPREPLYKDKSIRGYEIIFMDCEMPVLNGFKAAPTLTDMMKSGEIRWVPIVGCTGHSDEKKTKECLTSGMTEFILYENR